MFPPRADRDVRGVDGPVPPSGRPNVGATATSSTVQAEMSALTLAVVGETLFGTDVDAERSATVRRALTDTLGMFDRVYSPLFRLLVRLPSPTMRRYHRVESDLNRVIAEMIADAVSPAPPGDDLLSLLLRAREDGEA
jgi:cytochrome P450